tara:strand:+ start:199 stop:324 length:126 start_codon:yes stop_codon:yes gene_type:complete
MIAKELRWVDIGSFTFLFLPNRLQFVHFQALDGCTAILYRK